MATGKVHRYSNTHRWIPYTACQLVPAVPPTTRLSPVKPSYLCQLGMQLTVGYASSACLLHSLLWILFSVFFFLMRTYFVYIDSLIHFQFIHSNSLQNEYQSQVTLIVASSFLFSISSSTIATLSISPSLIAFPCICVKDSFSGPP